MTNHTSTPVDLLEALANSLGTTVEKAVQQYELDVLSETGSLEDIAATINRLYRAGRRVMVDGREVRTIGHMPARTFKNGSLSVDTRSFYSSGKRYVLWFKADGRRPAITVA